jgi:hypothetical protein
MSEDLQALASDAAMHAGAFLAGVEQVSTGASPQTAVAELLVHVAQALGVGAMLGAIDDVIPPERFEADAGRDPDADPLRDRLAALLEGLDEYAYVVDPLLPDKPVIGRVSDDVADIAVDLAHGLRHYQADRPLEALWWWQFSYLSNWGDHALCAHRSLLSVLAHQRLDADALETQAAEADALLSPES